MSRTRNRRPLKGNDPVLQAPFSLLFATASPFAMTNRSPYGPDHSLLHAVLILLGGLGVIAAGVYLLTTIDEPFSEQSQVQVAEAPTQASPRSPVPSGATARRGVSTPGGGPPVGGGVPAWARSSGPSAPSGPFAPAPQGSYDIDPDFSQGQLGAPSPPSGGGPGGGTIADVGSPGESGSTGRTPATSSSAPDMSGRSFGGSVAGRGSPQWRSEAQALASRSRALSNTLGRIDRQGSREASRSRSEEAKNDPSGEATTSSGPGASSSSTPGMPDDPDQVPLGGAEWLAAAGAAYALNRLREKEGDESEDDA
jgi:hypothetical protein